MVNGATTCDVAIVGGGPAGLAAGIAAAARGLAVTVVEKRAYLPDKACGEGVLPPGVRALEQLGVGPYLTNSPLRRFRGIRFCQEDGSSTAATLPAGGGLGIRRTVLVDALLHRALALGVTVRAGCEIGDVERSRRGAMLRTASGAVAARLVVAADGLHSPLRRAAGLEARPGTRRRVALRQHFAVRPWTDFVEVHVDCLGEAVMTPISDDSINVNFVWEHGEIDRARIETLLDRFPVLRARLAGAPAVSTVKGAGPMACRATRRTAERLVLLGDAAGFIDSISADGLSIAFNSALVLGEHLPAVLAGDATVASLQAYERAARGLFRSYWAVTNALLWIARHQRLRLGLVHYLARHPDVCRAIMGGAMNLMLAPA